MCLSLIQNTCLRVFVADLLFEDVCKKLKIIVLILINAIFVNKKQGHDTFKKILISRADKYIHVQHFKSKMFEMYTEKDSAE